MRRIAAVLAATGLLLAAALATANAAQAKPLRAESTSAVALDIDWS
jgi:hypothetical protein